MGGKSGNSSECILHKISAWQSGIASACGLCHFCALKGEGDSEKWLPESRIK